MTRELPPGLRPYRRTPVFTETTLPAGLRSQHQTKPGVWGVVSVLEGRLHFRRLAPPEDLTLDAGATAVIAPEEPHEVEPLGPVRFFVEFYAA